MGGAIANKSSEWKTSLLLHFDCCMASLTLRAHVELPITHADSYFQPPLIKDTEYSLCYYTN